MSEQSKFTEFNALTGIITERDLTQDEIKERAKLLAKTEQEKAEAEAKIAARQSALAKLAALGLTEAEIAAL
jgi:DNA-binding NarL/FixJ family response regulator